MGRIAKENAELMNDCCPQHSSTGTAGRQESVKKEDYKVTYGKIGMKQRRHNAYRSLDRISSVPPVPEAVDLT